jgi:hypothetical protein
VDLVKYLPKAIRGVSVIRANRRRGVSGSGTANDRNDSSRQLIGQSVHHLLDLRAPHFISSVARGSLNGVDLYHRRVILRLEISKTSQLRQNCAALHFLGICLSRENLKASTPFRNRDPRTTKAASESAARLRIVRATCRCKPRMACRALCPHSLEPRESSSVRSAKEGQL